MTIDPQVQLSDDQIDKIESSANEHKRKLESGEIELNMDKLPGNVRKVDEIAFQVAVFIHNKKKEMQNKEAEK